MNLYLDGTKEFVLHGFEIKNLQAVSEKQPLIFTVLTDTKEWCTIGIQKIIATIKIIIATTPKNYCDHTKKLLRPSKKLLRPSKKLLRPSKKLLRPSKKLLRPSKNIIATIQKFSNK